jgi:hypothetical protein
MPTSTQLVSTESEDSRRVRFDEDDPDQESDQESEDEERPNFGGGAMMAPVAPAPRTRTSMAQAEVAKICEGQPPMSASRQMRLEKEMQRKHTRIEKDEGANLECSSCGKDVQGKDLGITAFSGGNRYSIACCSKCWTDCNRDEGHDRVRRVFSGRYARALERTRLMGPNCELKIEPERYESFRLCNVPILDQDIPTMARPVKQVAKANKKSGGQGKKKKK